MSDEDGEGEGDEDGCTGVAGAVGGGMGCVDFKFVKSDEEEGSGVSSRR